MHQRHPTAEWAAQQIVEAFPGDRKTPRFLIRDRDSIYGDVFRRKTKVMGIREVVIARKSPWQNPYCERVVGTIRRECTDHIIALGERHLLRVLREFIAYYHQRPHTNLAGNSPVPRCVARGDGDVVGTPVLGGLHHTYRRAA